ncbi:hypothetical protein CALCODRAFT_371024 [Calocera cornea HHB12733]|uniref:F-box domain-containing protein n=1 Tax=Calocera cornea HHB12733 TaxID=1353952 RepID=A0A165EH98_9BASI|nr:hypothetical protein CALCODRAFT_371024 [Calocera cornea HHB12733]
MWFASVTLPRTPSFHSSHHTPYTLIESERSGSRLLPVVRVCKRWNRVVDKLIYSRLEIRFPRNLYDIAKHLRTASDVQHAATQLWIARQAAKVDPWAIVRVHLELSSLFERLSALRSIHSEISLRSNALSALLDTSGGTLLDAYLFISQYSFDSSRIHLFNRLVHLKHLWLVFYYDGAPAKDIDKLRAGIPTISLPALESLRLEYAEYRPEYNIFVAALDCRSLTALHVETQPLMDHSGNFLPVMGTDLDTFLQRHSGTITNVTLWSTSPEDNTSFMRALPALQHLRITGPAGPYILRALPPSVTKLEVPLSQRPYSTTVWPPPAIPQAQWQFLADLADLPPLSLRSVRAMTENMSLRWKTLEQRAEGDVVTKFKTTALVMKMKGIDLLDSDGFAYEAQKIISSDDVLFQA